MKSKHLLTILFLFIVHLLHAQTITIVEKTAGALTYKSGAKIDETNHITTTPVGTITDYSWTLDGESFDLNNTLTRKDDGKVLRHIGKDNDTKTVISNGLPLTVIDKPKIIEIAGFPATVSVGQTLSLSVNALSNGSPITKYEWFLGSTKIGESTTSNVLNYNIKNTDHNKVIKVKVTNACGTDEASTSFDTSATIITDQNTSLIAQKVDNTTFPVTVGQDFDDPVIDYTSSLNKYYFVTQIASGSTTIETTTTSTYIPYLNTSYDCYKVSIAPDTDGKYYLPPVILKGNHTVFIDKGKYYPNKAGGGQNVIGSEAGLKLIGANLTPPVIGPNYHKLEAASNSGHVSYKFQKDMIVENIVFDGDNMKFYGHYKNGGSNYHNNYYFFTIDNNCVGLVMKNIKLKNIGTTTGYSVFNFFSITTGNRYFLDITIESANLSNSYPTMNINISSGLRFRNLKIENAVKGAGIGVDNSSISITGASNYTSNSNDIIFAGTLDIPNNKRIRIISDDSRGISFPTDYKYLQLNTVWDPANIKTSNATPSTSTKDYAILIEKNNNTPITSFSGTQSRLVFDALESTYIVQPELTSNTIQDQLDKIKTLFNNTNINTACTLPSPTIKLIADNGLVGGFTVPDLGDLPVNIVALNSISDPLNKTDLIKYNNSTISFDNNNAANVKLHNIDFSDYYTLNNAIKDGDNNVVNSRYGSFYNCKFKDYKAKDDLKIKGDIIATLSGDNKLCKDDSGNTNLQLALTGGNLSDEWDVTVSTDISNSSKNQTINGVSSANVGITHPTISTGSETYNLIKVKNSSKEAFITTATATVTVNDLPTATISGSKTINKGESAELEITLTGDAPWTVVVNNHGTISGINTSTYKFTVTPTTTTTYSITSVTSDKGCNGTVSGNAIITVKTSTTPPTPPIVDPNPEPKPEKPDPEKPQPETGIRLEGLQIVCSDETIVTIPFELIYKGSPIQYQIKFSEESKTAGCLDETAYKPLPTNNTISFIIPSNMPNGKYKGTIVLKTDTSNVLNSNYPFEFEVMSSVKIVKQPVSASSICEGDGFKLTVEAVGDELAYQWYLNDKKIEGANQPIYEAPLSKENEGVYFVEVIGFCGAEKSQKITISGNNFRILIKWDDVLYVLNLDNRYVSYQWYKNGSPIEQYGKAVYYTHPDGLVGTYKVRAYKTDGTYDESCSMTFAEKTKAISAAVYPNPVARNENLSVVIPEIGESKATINIYDIAGRQVYGTQTTTTKTDIPANLPTGAYIVKVTLQSGKTVNQKLIVK